MTKSKAIVLLSGGLDSCTCLALAIQEVGHDNVHTISVSYGQKHSKELKCAEDIAKHYGVPHQTLDISEIFKSSNCSLLSNSTENVPEGSYDEQIEKSGRVSTYVPFRNGAMLSIVAAVAQSIWPNDYVSIYLGNHQDDAAGEAYPDCSLAFTQYMDKAISQGTYGLVHLKSPFVNNTKADIVAWGLKHNVPYEKSWSCYNGNETPCHRCGTCIDREAAFKANGTIDPLCK